MAQPWQTATFTAMTANFVPLLAPANPTSFDTLQFYNQALAIVAGCGVGAISFRLVLPLSPAFRTRRLLRLTLRDLRRLAVGRVPRDWEGHVHGRLAAMPVQATPLQRAQLLAALSAGVEIIRLRRTARGISVGASLDRILTAVAQGQSATAITLLARLDAALAAHAAGPARQSILRVRGSMLALSDVLTEHAAYFDAGAAG